MAWQFPWTKQPDPPPSVLHERGVGTIVASVPLLEGLQQSALLPRQIRTPLSHGQLRTLAQHPSVWTARRTMIAKAQGLNWRVVVEEGARQTERTRMATLAAATILNRPNTRFRTFSDWLGRSLDDFYVSGSFFSEIELGANGWPVSMWNLPADQIVTQQLDASRDWRWVQQTPSGKVIALNPEEVVWATRAPRYDLSGDTLAVIQDVITRLAALDTYIGSQFSSLGMLTQALLHFPGAPDDALETLRAALNARRSNKDEVLISAIETYGGEAKNLTVRPSNKESDLLPYRESLERQIWAYHGGTALQAGIPSGQNRSIAAVSRQEANEGIFKGDMEKVEDALSAFCKLFHPDLMFEFPDLDTLDPLSMVQLYTGQLAYKTPNEVRAAQSLPPIKDGDVIVGVNGVSTNSGVGQTPGAEESETTDEVVDA